MPASPDPITIRGTRTQAYVPVVQADGGITWAQVGTAGIADGAVTPAKVLAGGSSGQVPSKSGSTWAWLTPAVAADITSAVATHEADTTSIHGIADTSVLETTTGAQAKADNAETAASEYADSLFAGAVVKSPAGSDTNVVQPTADVPNLKLKLRSAQTANPLEVRSSADVLLARVLADGSIEVGGQAVVLTNDSRLPTSGQKSALAGSSGTPGASNPYVTQLDNSLRIRERIVRVAQGMKHETFPAGTFVGYTNPGTGVAVGGLIAGLTGETLTGVGFVVGTTGTPTSCWVALHRSSGGTYTRVALSADTPGAVGTGGLRTIAFATPYVPAADEALYISILQVGGTPATLARGNNSVANAYLGVAGGAARFYQQTGLSSFPDPLVPAATGFPIYLFVY